MIFHKHSHVGLIGDRNIQILEHIQNQLPGWHIIDSTYLFRLKPVYWREPENRFLYNDTITNRRLLVQQLDPGTYLENNEFMDQLDFNHLPCVSDVTCDWNFWAWMYGQEREYFNLNSIPLNLKDDFNHFLFFNKKAPLHRKHAIDNIINHDLTDYGIVTVDDGELYMTFEGNDPTTADGGHGGSQLFTTGRDGPGDGGLGNNNIWSNTFCYIVGETTFNDRFLSEKTWKPIIAKRPFLHLHPEKYKALQDMGFKTFNCLWDEERDWFENLLHLTTCNKQQVQDMYDSVQDILDYNYDYFWGEFQEKNIATLNQYLLQI